MRMERGGRDQARPQDSLRDSPAANGPPRLGPRPILTHLGIATGSWIGSVAGLPLLRTGSLSWRPELAAQAAALRSELESVDPDAFDAAVRAEGQRRVERFVAGVEAYRHHPYRRGLSDPPVAWRDGTARLLDFGAAGGAPAHGLPLLVIPSLINRAYVLDLSERASLMRWLAAPGEGRGFRPFLVDWGAPGTGERRFTLTDYIAGRLDGALDAVRAATGRKPALVGYCMGGLLALALAQRRAADIAGLACLATPWDFHAERAEHARLLGASLVFLEPMLALFGELPVDAIQLLFASVDPYQAMRKFSAFAALDPASPQAEAFVALEDWLNDGVALAAPVARECLAGWYGANTPAHAEWRIDGRPVRPADYKGPTLIVLPARDRIVPPASAAALAAALPQAQKLEPHAGHIGMVVGGGAEAKLYRPLAAWLRDLG
jgi:polyhydroxyalkanoate synthase